MHKTILGVKPFKVAFISDIHTDFYVSPAASGSQLLQKMIRFIDGELRLKDADILIFAGDNSHYPTQNQVMLELIASRGLYKKIFVTYGNHDQYIISNRMSKEYKVSSNKLTHLKSICEGIDTVEYLDGNIVEIEKEYTLGSITSMSYSTATTLLKDSHFSTITLLIEHLNSYSEEYNENMTRAEFNKLVVEYTDEKPTVSVGGTGGFYDFSYGIQRGMTKESMLNLWYERMNDSIRIKEIYHEHELGYSNDKNRTNGNFDPLRFFNAERILIENIIQDCDIFVTHVGPVVPKDIYNEPVNMTNGFYYYDGEKYLIDEKAPKLYIFGHTHRSYDFKFNNTHLMCNPLGYKGERPLTEIMVVDFFELD